MRGRYDWVSYKYGLSSALIVLVVLTASACTTGAIHLRTTPSIATVRVRAMGDGDWKDVGQTPVTIEARNFKNPAGVGPGALIVSFSKEGYIESRSVIAGASTSDVTLDVELEPKAVGDAPEKINTVIDKLFEGQALARAERYEDALEKLRGVEKEAPQIAATYELEGGIYYMMKRNREALDAYAMAVKLDPANPQTIKMLDTLRTAVASQTAPTDAKPGKLIEGGP